MKLFFPSSLFSSFFPHDVRNERARVSSSVVRFRLTTMRATSSAACKRKLNQYGKKEKKTTTTEKAKKKTKIATVCILFRKRNEWEWMERKWIRDNSWNETKRREVVKFVHALAHTRTRTNTHTLGTKEEQEGLQIMFCFRLFFFLIRILLPLLLISNNVPVS